MINLSSAAQAPVELDVLTGRERLEDEFALYAQSKLALTCWTRHLALQRKGNEPIFIALNPGSMLASKMVQQGFGVAGKDIAIGADILVRAALTEEFATANGCYFDNDQGKFASPHLDALDPQCGIALVDTIDAVLASL